MNEPPFGDRGATPGAADPVVRRRSAPVVLGPHRVLGMPARYAAALLSTAVAIVVLLLAAAFGGGRSEEPVVVPTTTASTSVVVVGGPPRTIEVLPDWYRKGYSLYSDRAPTPTVSSLPPTTVDEEDGSGSGSGSNSGSNSRSNSGSG